MTMLTFVRQCLRDFQHTGAVAPSSGALARAMTVLLRRHPSPRRVLEVGPGTGPFTRQILRSLRPGDAFDVVEINPAFCRRLRERTIEPYVADHRGINVTLHEGPVQDVPIAGPYDFIVCGLPFNNFEPALARAILAQLMALLAVGGHLTYFEYAGVRAMKAPLVGAAGRQRLRRISAIGKSLRRRNESSSRLVIANFPPAVAFRVTRREG